MQPTMPTPLSAHSHYLSLGGRTTTVVHKGYMYEPEGECTWELLAPLEVLEKENRVYHACMYWLRPDFRDLGRCCRYFLCAIEPPHSDVSTVSAPTEPGPNCPPQRF